MSAHGNSSVAEPASYLSCSHWYPEQLHGSNTLCFTAAEAALDLRGGLRQSTAIVRRHSIGVQLQSIASLHAGVS